MTTIQYDTSYLYYDSVYFILNNFHPYPLKILNDRYVNVTYMLSSLIFFKKNCNTFL